MLKKIHESEVLKIDLRYGSCDNFLGRVIYAFPHCYLHPEAAVCLEKAGMLAKSMGFGLRIFDAFRPVEAQWALWEQCPNPDYIADPRRGSAHSRGIAIDLTLFSLENGRDLDMGTAFDAFTPLSHHGLQAIEAECLKNRSLLLGIMSSCGWDFYQKEWWHYQLFHAQNYPLLEDAACPEPMMGDPKHPS
jgi:D-alanyl-D-alanine dipeptidase